MNKSVENVDSFIEKRKSRKHSDLTQLWFRRFSLLIINGLLIGMLFLYMQTSIDFDSSTTIEGNYYLSKQDIINSANLNDPNFKLFKSANDINMALMSNPFIKQTSIKVKTNDHFIVELAEKKVVGIVQHTELSPSLLLEDGVLISLNADLLRKTLSMPIIYDFYESTDLIDISQELAQLDNEILVIISEIHLKEKRFEETYLQVHMQDGNRVFIPVSALKALENYYIIMQEYPMKDICIFIDDINSNPYQAECIE
jgi:cell division septal protein FtsQ